MIVDLASPAKRGGLVCIAVVVGIYLTYFSVRTARATYYTGLETLYGYERATQIEPENPRNWYLLGRYLQYSLEDANPQRSISSYLTSLRLEPQATVTWLDLAATYETEGNDAEAKSAFLEAKKTYPASAEVSWRYGNFLLRQGKLDQAFTEIRHSVESDPLRAPEAFSRCVRIEPNADVILDRVIPANREVYIAVMHDLIGDRQVDNALKVWKRLLAMHAEVPMPEIFGLVSALRQIEAIFFFFFAAASRSVTYCCTAARHGFQPAVLPYLELLWDELRPSGLIDLLLVHTEGNYLAGLLLTRFGDGTTERISGYAPERVPRKKMRPNEALRWAAMVNGRENGEQWYDLGGVEYPIAEALAEGADPGAEAMRASRSAHKVGLGGTPLLYPPPLELFPNRVLRVASRAVGDSDLAAPNAGVLASAMAVRVPGGTTPRPV